MPDSTSQFNTQGFQTPLLSLTAEQEQLAQQMANMPQQIALQAMRDAYMKGTIKAMDIPFLQNRVESYRAQQQTQPRPQQQPGGASMAQTGLNSQQGINKYQGPNQSQGIASLPVTDFNLSGASGGIVAFDAGGNISQDEQNQYLQNMNYNMLNQQAQQQLAAVNNAYGSENQPVSSAAKGGAVKRFDEGGEASDEAELRLRETLAGINPNPLREEDKPAFSFGDSPKQKEMINGYEFDRPTLAELYGGAVGQIRPKAPPAAPVQAAPQKPPPELMPAGAPPPGSQDTGVGAYGLASMRGPATAGPETKLDKELEDYRKKAGQMSLSSELDVMSRYAQQMGIPQLQQEQRTKQAEFEKHIQAVADRTPEEAQSRFYASMMKGVPGGSGVQAIGQAVEDRENYMTQQNKAVLDMWKAAQESGQKILESEVLSKRGDIQGAYQALRANDQLIGRTFESSTQLQVERDRAAATLQAERMRVKAMLARTDDPLARPYQVEMVQRMNQLDDPKTPAEQKPLLQQRIQTLKGNLENVLGNNQKGFGAEQAALNKAQALIDAEAKDPESILNQMVEQAYKDKVYPSRSAAMMGLYQKRLDMIKSSMGLGGGVSPAQGAPAQAAPSGGGLKYNPATGKIE